RCDRCIGGDRVRQPATSENRPTIRITSSGPGGQGWSHAALRVWPARLHKKSPQRKAGLHEFDRSSKAKLRSPNDANLRVIPVKNGSTRLPFPMPAASQKTLAKSGRGGL